MNTYFFILKVFYDYGYYFNILLLDQFSKLKCYSNLQNSNQREIFIFYKLIL
ncbi:hypothetical protein CHRYSEO8AT_750004 [Chryseobacterium sp. 8AT]|nr:hypothetical protein CHRYSEO8AT_750004 [Chryseobacterium sp. 8AT]